MNEQSKVRAFEAGKAAADTGNPIGEFKNKGWGYPKGMYFPWFQMGFYGDAYRSSKDAPEIPYAELKARNLIADAYRDIGRHSKADAILRPDYQSMTLRAFAAYIDRME